MKLITPTSAAKFRAKAAHKWRGTTLDAWLIVASQRHLAERPIVLFHSNGILAVAVK
jgi:hypothetical protein